MSSVSFLLVDDLEENLLSLEALLRRDGLTLLKARSGDQALELLLQHDVALALVDVQMPGLNGFELAELMRGNERTRRVPIIFVTAGSNDSLRRFQGYEAGAVDFIQKPIEPDILRGKAEVFFELYRQRQQIAAQRDELEVQAEALREADRRKDEFLATLAHELRNPLAPLRNGLDILRRSPDTRSGGEIREMMDRQLTQLVRLIDDLLDVSRVSQGKIELRKEAVKVQDVINAAVETSRPLIDANNHSLSLAVAGEALWLKADHVRLAQALSNLLNNAAKYTPDGGRIGLSVRQQGENILIEVSDNGVGIPAEMQSRVFQLFTQIDDHLSRSQGGLGIGLALVKQLIAMHNGTVVASSAGPGLGSTFSIWLPLVAAPEATLQKESEPVMPAQPHALKVLVVDDNPIIADTLGMMLEQIGHQFEAVHDGREALEAARAYGPDVILLDIGLPGMDGYEVCRAFRRDEAFKHIPIVAQTGWGQARDKELAFEVGFDFHLTKPVPLADLEKYLKTVQPIDRMEFSS
ncbi:His Kinase A (phospho-acceptor) domain-containing protein [Rhizobium sp. NFR07]|uniref:response regulator n=1 Tax=Rhizobium sp. NFR07 TaxID=1566262 RepID=UPI0008E6EBB3|nr:response regulator [Rhizobium sp. NFR07]SFB64961.1 His Kinase A (phospho-acceptor) domain-containing protein [Rhizobium sp. NFR07]